MRGGTLVLCVTDTWCSSQSRSQWLCKHFIQFGVPDVIILTDGGPLLNAAAWKNFLEKWGITCYLSLAMYPESNSRVKVAKRLFREEGVDFPKSLQWTWHGQDQGGGKVETGHAYQYPSSSAGGRHSPGLESDFFKTNEKVMDIDNTVWELMGVAVLQVQVKPKFCLGLFLVWSWSTVGLANAWSLWHMYKVRLGEIRLG